MRPLCRECNLSMGSRNWDDWIDLQKKLYLVPSLSDDAVSYSSDFEPESPKNKNRKPLHI